MKKSSLTATLFVWCCVYAQSYASQPPAPTPSENAQKIDQQSSRQVQDAKQDKRGTDESPFAVSGKISAVIEGEITAKKDAAEADENRRIQDEESAKKRIELLLLGFGTVFTLILTIATVFLAVYTFRLWKVTAKVVTDASLASNRQLRAYVSQWADEEPEPTEDGYQVIIKLRNGGATPAFVTNIRSRIEIIEDAESHVFDAIEARAAPQRFTMFPNAGPHHHGMRATFAEALIGLVRTRRAEIHIRGAILYQTLGEEHETHFHLHFATGIVDGVLKGGWRYFEGGDNSAN